MGLSHRNGVPLSKIAAINGVPLSKIAAINGVPLSILVLRNLALRRDKPFFTFVLTYLVSSAGLSAVYDAENAKLSEGLAGSFPGKVQGDLQANLAECVALARDGSTLPREAAEQALCCMLANSAFESIEKAVRDTLRDEPVFQFFRHVRNAASHGNTWHFSSAEPARPAAWQPAGGRRIEIDHALRGEQNPMHGNKCFYGDIQPADLLYLLKDVEDLVALRGADRINCGGESRGSAT